MGLDMYLNRMPRSEATPRQIRAIEEYFGYQKEVANGRTDTFKQWCGFSESDLPESEVIDFYRPHYRCRYYLWDEEKRYPYESIMEEVAYWRKANQIHNWFVQNIQDGYDDCNYHHEVTEDDLLCLLSSCKTVLKNVKKMDNGEVVVNQIAKEILPTQGGFFFGDVEYDEYYVNDIENTVEMIEKVLATTNFDTQMIYYVSSW